MKGIKELLIQFSKFAAIGVMNTGLDFGVLNLLMLVTGVRGGLVLALLNSISFSVATINSYLWNKYWTFRDKDTVHTSEIGQFLAISLVGLGINSSIVYFISTFVDPVFGFSPTLWVNISKVIATGFALIWNFWGYKFIVFKK